MIDYSQEGWFGFCGGIWRCTFSSGSVLPGAVAISLLSGALAVGLSVLSQEAPELWEDTGIEGLKASQLWAAQTAALLFLIGFRTNKAYGRFWDGTTLLHQMWGEWFDAASCLIAFSSQSTKTQPADVAQFRHTLIRLMSLCHGAAMEEISPERHQRHICLDVGGLDQQTLKYLFKATNDPNLGFNRVEVLIHMIQTLVVFNQGNGVLKIPPPILSRCFQTLSRGQVNLANAKKITSTLFPFPYAQLIGVLLILSVICTPVAMASIISSKHWAAVFTILPILALFGLNYVACQLEMPFGTDPNDLPLNHFQDHMNTSLLMLIRPETDLVPHVHEFCATSFDDIKTNLHAGRIRDYLEEEEPPMGDQHQPSLGAKSFQVARRRQSQFVTALGAKQEPKDIQAKSDKVAKANQMLAAASKTKSQESLQNILSSQQSAQPSLGSQASVGTKVSWQPGASAEATQSSSPRIILSQSSKSLDTVKEEDSNESQQPAQQPAQQLAQQPAQQKVDNVLRKSQTHAGKPLEESLQKSMGVLSTKFEELVGHINGLTAQMGKSTDEFRNLMANANHLSYQMDAARYAQSNFTIEDNAPSKANCWTNCGGAALRRDTSSSRREDRFRSLPPSQYSFPPPVAREHRWASLRETQAMTLAVGENKGMLEVDNI